MQLDAVGFEFATGEKWEEWISIKEKLPDVTANYSNKEVHKDATGHLEQKIYQSQPNGFQNTTNLEKDSCRLCLSRQLLNSFENHPV